MPDIPLESDEQIAVVAYCERNDLKFTAIPNSTYTSYHSQKRKNYNEGLRAGFPDMVVITSSGLLAIEMKRTKGARVTDEQQEWIDALQGTPGVEAQICKGHLPAIELIRKFEPSAKPHRAKTCEPCIRYDLDQMEGMF